MVVGHGDKDLKRVLEMDGISVGHEFVEHLRTMGQFLIVGAVAVEQSDGLTIATTCI